MDIPGVGSVETSQFDLDTVDTVDTVDEQDKNEDERYLWLCLDSEFARVADTGGVWRRTFIPYCSLATMGLSDMKVKSFRLTVKGRGTIRPTKIAISVTRRTNTCAIVSRAGRSLAASGHTYEGEVECHYGVCLAWLWRAANKQRS